MLEEICGEDWFFYKEISDYLSQNFYLFVLIIRSKSKYSSWNREWSCYHVFGITDCSLSLQLLLKYRVSTNITLFPLLGSHYLLRIELLNYLHGNLQASILSAIKAIRSSKKRAYELTIYINSSKENSSKSLMRK